LLYLSRRRYNLGSEHPAFYPEHRREQDPTANPEAQVHYLAKSWLARLLPRPRNRISAETPVQHPGSRARAGGSPPLSRLGAGTPRGQRRRQVSDESQVASAPKKDSRCAFGQPA